MFSRDDEDGRSISFVSTGIGGGAAGDDDAARSGDGGISSLRRAGRDADSGADD